MKPRDPRRILHGNSLHKNPSTGHEYIKTIVPPPTSSIQGSKDSLNAQNQKGEADAKSVHSQSVAPPDIAHQFTKNLKNIADIISVSQASTTPIISQNTSSETVQVKSDKVDTKAVASNSEDQRSLTSAALEVGVAIASRSENVWGDVEHLFEGYDDQQKAAIQRERARRIEEQKKMFAAHKLCLVLDLDHTLLNSAKVNSFFFFFFSFFQCWSSKNVYFVISF